MTTLRLKYGNNTTEFKWHEIIDAAYHNLGSRAGVVVVHFTVDIKDAMRYIGSKTLDIEHGLLVDTALEWDLRAEYPKEDMEYLDELMFFRAFVFDTENVETIEEKIHEIFSPGAPDHVWINGKLHGGLCYPQEQDSEDNYPPVKETLSDYVWYRPAETVKCLFGDRQ